MRLPSDKAVIRVSRHWGNGFGNVVRQCVPPLTWTVAVLTVAAMVIEHQLWRFGFDQREGRAIERAIIGTAAQFAFVDFLCCLFARIATSDPAIRTKRPIGRYFAVVMLCLLGVLMIPQIN